ncbi:MAG: histidine phosphatase family protein [Alphaproteobacteria bacterium]|nr:histidine phosphatase family protein [Alphaproteobacteria bacterium]
MLKLHLLRHAEAPSAFNVSDKDRPLSPHGIQQAKSIADHLKHVDLVLCSSALRTQMTCKALTEAGANFETVKYLDELYNASAETLLNTVRSSISQNILVIAHNPGIHAFSTMMMGDGKSTDIEKVNLFYHPATLSVFECPIENWSDIQPFKNTLIDLVIPD